MNVCFWDEEWECFCWDVLDIEVDMLLIVFIFYKFDEYIWDEDGNVYDWFVLKFWKRC